MTPDPELPVSAASTSPLETSLRAEVTKILFTSEDGQYGVVRVVDSSCEEHVLIGPLTDLQEGQHIEAVGKVERHKTYGQQLRVREVRVVLPQTPEGMTRYLASGILPGVGEKMAARIVQHFGADTFRVLDQYSGRLGEIRGLGAGRIARIREAWREQSSERELQAHLQGIGLSKAYANRVVKAYGPDAPALIQENPYRLATDIRGIGFRMADAVARQLQIGADNPFRLAAGVAYVLAEFAQQRGHTCVPMPLLRERATAVLEVGEEAVDIGVKRASDDGAAIVHPTDGEPLVYPARLYDAEQSLTRMLQRFMPSPEFPGMVAAPRTAEAHWQQLNAEQREAVAAAFANPLSIITGGPGVGKTTTTRAIVASAHDLDLKLSLCAPTGRAAKRLAESSGENAQTIHRLLRWDPEQLGFTHNMANPMQIDLLIVDEVSMLDLPLAVALFAAVSPGTHVVLVGDRDQLPSVGPGSVLHDLIVSDRFPVTELQQVYRQGAGSLIIQNAHRVNSGRMPAVAKAAPDELLDYYWIDQEDPAQVLTLIGALVKERIPRRFGLRAGRDIQVLSPMNRGDCGVNQLNRHLQALLNPPGPTPVAVNYGETQFRVGDRVMQTSNNYDLHVYNGDLGAIREIRPELKQLTVDFDGLLATYAFDEIEQLQLAYATTIHKSQGSEFPAVIVPLLGSHYIMLRRKLLYTAMTRAKQLLILIGSPRALAQAVDDARVTQRFSYLSERLRQLD